MREAQPHLDAELRSAGESVAWWRDLWLVVALLIATFITYAPAVTAEFIWNDADYVTAPGLRSTEGLARIWFELGATEQYYPLLHSAFWVQHKLWGDWPTAYHVWNILLHASCACLLVAVLRRLQFAPRAAWLAGFLFALHPVYVESVAWISEQKNTQSLLFYLIAAWLYLGFDRTRSPRTYALATFVFVLALLSKSVTATLPPALLVVFWWKRGSLTWRGDVVPLLPWFALGAAMGLFSAYVEKNYIGAHGAEFELSLLQRALLAGRIVWFYLGKLLWPAELVFIYPRWSIDPGEIAHWAFSVAVLATLAVLYAWRRRTRAPLAAALFFGGSLFPTLGFFNVYAFLFSFVADHWQYLPSIGVVCFAAAGLTRGMENAPAVFRAAVPIVLLAALACVSFDQSRTYRDLRTFYRSTLARNPDAWMAHNNLGNLLREARELEGARAHFEAALRVRPDLVKVHNNLANVLRDLKRPREAIPHYRRALELDANYIEAHNNLGSILREHGDKLEALRHLQRAVQLDPQFADAQNNLGMTLRDLGRLPEAVNAFQRAVRLQPDMAPAHLNLALTFSLLGRDDESVHHYELARRFNPSIPPLRVR
jgi:tetratricopeptide (TPR) repeat protein